MKFVVAGSAFAASLVFLPFTAIAANDSPWMVRARGLLVAPAESASISPIGGDVQIDNSFVPEVDVTYFFAKNFAVELIAAVTPHDVSHTAGVDLGSAWLLPPTLTLQYHFDPDGAALRPYVGVGINYTTFFGVDEPAGLSISYDDSFGLALQAGIDIPFGNGWSANIDVKKVYINTDVTILGLGPVVRADVDIDPVIFGMGVGYRY
jgi:outer membrane protein